MQRPSAWLYARNPCCLYHTAPLTSAISGAAAGAAAAATLGSNAYGRRSCCCRCASRCCCILKRASLYAFFMVTCHAATHLTDNQRQRVRWDNRGIRALLEAKVGAEVKTTRATTGLVEAVGALHGRKGVGFEKSQHTDKEGHGNSTHQRHDAHLGVQERRERDSQQQDSACVLILEINALAHLAAVHSQHHGATALSDHLVVLPDDLLELLLLAIPSVVVLIISAAATHGVRDAPRKREVITAIEVRLFSSSSVRMSA
jgi:hypothetical protein